MITQIFHSKGKNKVAKKLETRLIWPHGIAEDKNVAYNGTPINPQKIRREKEIRAN